MRVLVVDDEPSLGDVLLLLLEAEGCAVEWINDPHATEAAVEAFQPDAVLLDVAMPDRDGTEVTAALKARWPHLRIVLYSARHDTAQFRQVVQDLGVDAYLSKPFDLDELMAALRGTG